MLQIAKSQPLRLESSRLTPEDATRPLTTKVGRRIEKELLRKAGYAVKDHNLIEDGDRILVGMSGGKDSYTLLRILSLMRHRAPVNFDLVAVNIDQGYRGYRADVIEDYCQSLGYETHIESTDVADIVFEKIQPGKTHCSLCARLRRGITYTVAQRLGCNKIALGHHADDAIETVLLNLFFNGELKSMPAFLRAEDGKNLVIRPLIYCGEAMIMRYSQMMEFPLIGCMCPACGDQALQRARVKNLLAEWDQQHPGLKSSMLTALRNVRADFLLDHTLIKRLEETR